MNIYSLFLFTALSIRFIFETQKILVGMSASWYECKVKYRKFDEASGMQKMKTEPFLVDAISYTEAESRITQEMSAYLSDSDEIKITNIKVSNFAEIHPFENSDRWFKSKVSLIAYDDESGKEKKTNLYLLVQGNDVKEAYENTVSVMKDTMGEYTIPSVSESPIVDVFPYFSDEDENNEKEALENSDTLTDSVVENELANEKLELTDGVKI